MPRYEIPNRLICEYAGQIATAAEFLYEHIAEVQCALSVLHEGSLAVELYLKSLSAETVLHRLEGCEVLQQFGLYAVAARFPNNLSAQVPWQRVQDGVYDCRWGTDTIRVVVAGELPQEAHNAPLHLFSAAPNLVDFGGSAYRCRSEQTSRLLGQLFEKLRGEGFAVSFTMEDFNSQYVKEHFARLTPEERREALESLPPEEQVEVLKALSPEQRRAGLPPEQRLAGLPPEQRLAGLSPEQIRQYLDQLTAGRPASPRKPQRKK